MATQAEQRSEAEMETAAGAERSDLGDSEQDEEDDVFEVERIIDMKVEKGMITYRVRWKGYASDDDTWEPEEHLEDCKEVLHAFQRKMTETKTRTAKKESVLPTKNDIFDAESDSDGPCDSRDTSPRIKKKKNKLKELDTTPGSPKKDKKSKVDKICEPEKSKSEQQDKSPSVSPVNEKTSKTKKRTIEADTEHKGTKKQKKHDAKENGKSRKELTDAKKKQKISRESKINDTAQPQQETSDKDEGSADELSHDEQSIVSTEATDISVDEQAQEPTSSFDSTMKADAAVCLEQSPVDQNARQKKTKKHASEQRVKLQDIKELILEKKGVRSESSMSKRESTHLKLRNILAASRSTESSEKTQKSSKTGAEESEQSSDSSEGLGGVKRKAKSRVLDSSPELESRGKSKEEEHADKIGSSSGTPSKSKSISAPSSQEESEKEQFQSPSLFEKFLLNCEAKDRIPKKQSLGTATTNVEDKTENKTTGKSKAEKSKPAKDTSVSKAPPEKIDKSIAESKCLEIRQPESKVLKSAFDIERSPSQENEESKDKRDSPRSDHIEEAVSKWTESSPLERQRKREDSEPRLYIACDDTYDVQDTSMKAEKPTDSRPVLNLGVDLQLDWMTVEDFQKHLHGKDQNHITTTVSTSVLRDAVKNGDYLTVKLALNSKEEYNLDQEDSSGMTLLMLAAAGGQDDIIRLLLKRGVKINATQKAGTTALMHAAEKNFLTTVAILLEAGAHVNLQQLNGETALMKACKRGNIDIVKLLLEYGADSNMLSKHQNNALHFAKLSNNVLVYDLVKSHMDALVSVAEEAFRDYFESRLTIIEPCFPVACHRLCEGQDFSLEFNHKPAHSVTEGSGTLLFILHANFFNGTEIAARLCGPCSVQAVILNDKFQLPVFLGQVGKYKNILFLKDSHFIYSFSPVQGLNKLYIRFAEAPTAKVKLIITAYRVQLQ
ncbi:M-phase phosphoprotein 8 isoform X2 [Polypterus senegalus]|uniref:M-phase phosphoprotein 8 isoform X2 n=1 Tax=Polypterus senegalus TaxID=55291 RepID=UPI001963A30A|nr:M-phase phosphoprotein 8 isoform X2 [Polypterus senegalus]